MEDVQMENKKIGKLIADLRKNKGWTQSQLAEQLFVSDKAVSKWENGTGVPDTATFPRLAKVFGITTDELFAGELFVIKKPLVKEPPVDAPKRFVFIDTEGNIDQGKQGLKTFGFTVADEKLRILNKREVYIFADGEETGIKNQMPFNKMYCIIRDNLAAPKTYVLGFDVRHDADSINAACERFKTPPIDYKFFDVQQLYMEVKHCDKQPSLEQCVKALQINGEFDYHKSKADAHATACVMIALCDELGLTAEECIEKYSICGGYTKMYKTYLNREEKTETLGSCEAEGFKIRVDFPLVCFKKRVGAVLPNGTRDGVCFYYDPTLDVLFRDRHPHKVAKASDDSLIASFYEDATQKGLKKLQKEQPWFSKSSAPLDVRKFIVSYECRGIIEHDVLQIVHGKETLQDIKRVNRYVNMMQKAKLDPEAQMKKYYTADTFFVAMRKNAKWNYGDKNDRITLTPAQNVEPIDGDELYLPRAYEYVLAGRVGHNVEIACRREHMPFAKADEVLDIDTLHFDPSVAMLSIDDDGNAYRYIPIERKVYCAPFACSVNLPLLIRRKV